MLTSGFRSELERFGVSHGVTQLGPGLFDPVRSPVLDVPVPVAVLVEVGAKLGGSPSILEVLICDPPSRYTSRPSACAAVHHGTKSARPPNVNPRRSPVIRNMS